MKPLSDFKEGTFLKAENLPGKENALLNARVVGVRNEVLTGKDGASKDKVILKFAEFEPEFPLNLTNIETIQKLHGEDIDPTELVGQTFGLFVVPTPTGAGIRLRAPIPEHAVGSDGVAPGHGKVKDSDPRQIEEPDGFVDRDDVGFYGDDVGF